MKLKNKMERMGFSYESAEIQIANKYFREDACVFLCLSLGLKIALYPISLESLNSLMFRDFLFNDWQSLGEQLYYMQKTGINKL